MPILIAILLFSILVIAHEWGHFIVAKKNGIFVEEFAIGMGPLIYKKQKGETLYSVRLLPIGGFCKMLGEDTKLEDEDIDGSFGSKTVLQRIAVISAGSIMNFVLSFIFVLIVVLGNGFAGTTVGVVLESSPAAEVGIIPGDRIISIDGVRLRTFQDIRFALSHEAEGAIDLVIARDGQRLTKHLTPMYYEGAYLIGFRPVAYSGFFNQEGVSAGFFETINNAFWTVIHYIKLVLWTLTQLFTGNLSFQYLAGPVGIVSVIGDVYRQTIEVNIWRTVVQMLTLGALLSANLGVANLLPIPALDGARLVFLFLEAVRGKPISPEKEGVVHLVGFVLLMGLMLIVTFNDIARFFR